MKMIAATDLMRLVVPGKIVQLDSLHVKMENAFQINGNVMGKTTVEMVPMN